MRNIALHHLGAFGVLVLSAWAAWHSVCWFWTSMARLFVSLLGLFV